MLSPYKIDIPMNLKRDIRLYIISGTTAVYRNLSCNTGWVTKNTSNVYERTHINQVWDQLIITGYYGLLSVIQKSPDIYISFNYRTYGVYCIHACVIGIYACNKTS